MRGVFLLFLLLISWSPARTWTDAKSGRTIEADWVSSNGESITLKVVGGRLVTLPLERLTAEDQEFAAAQAAAAFHPAGWKRIQLTLPGFEDEARAVAMPGAFYRIGARAWTAELPPGCWIAIKSGMNPSDPYHHVFQWDGSTEWHFRVEGRSCYRATSADGKWERVGVSLANHRYVRITDELRRSIVAAGKAESVFCPYDKFEDETLIALDPVAVRIQVEHRSDLSPFAKLPRLKAISMSSQLQDLSSLASLDKIECFETNSGGSLVSRDKNPVPVGEMRSLRYLGVNFVGDVDGTPITKLERLQALSVGRLTFDSPAAITKLRQLHSLSLSGLDPRAVANMTRLVRLSSVFDRDSDLEPLLKLDKITALGFGLGSNIEFLNRWCAAGGLAHLRELRNFSADPAELKGFAGLRHLGLSAMRMTSMGEIRNVQTLDISLVTAEKLAEATHGQTQLASLSVSNSGTIDDLSAIPAMPDLKNLQISSLRGFTKIDGLSQTPTLERLWIAKCEDLTGITGLGSAAGLTELNIRGCPKLDTLSLAGLPGLATLELRVAPLLTSISGIGDLKSLTNIELGGLDKLASLDGWGAMGELRTIELLGCNALTSLEPLGALKNLALLSIFRCGAIPDPEVDKLRARLPDARISRSG